MTKRRFICYAVLLGFFCTQFSQYFVMAGFSFNQKYIATVMCVNKSRPWMHCNGHCYLMKKLKQMADKEKSAERDNIKNNIQVAICSAVTTINFAPQIQRTAFVAESPFLLPQRNSYIFQPPRA